MKIANEWKEYKILDMAEGQKLEKWGNVILSRPDPQIIWKEKTFPNKWKEINATYHRSKTGGGSWEFKKKIPNQWQIHYKNLTFNIKPMGFKHTGLFPEQAVNWDWMINKIKNEEAKQYLRSSPRYMMELLDYLREHYGSAKENLVQCGLEIEKIEEIIENFTI